MAIMNRSGNGDSFFRVTLEKKFDRPRKNGEKSMMRIAVTSCPKSTSWKIPAKKSGRAMEPECML